MNKIITLDIEKKSVNKMMKENAGLREKVKELESKISFLLNHKTMVLGLEGETLISKIINGKIKTYGESFDLLDRTGQRIEVKMASLNVAVKGLPTKRWAWNKIFGEKGKKEFDYIILIGEKDNRFSDLYLDKNIPYVIFCVPRRDFPKITDKTGFRENIYLTTNPAAARGKTAVLYTLYQITEFELKNRFNI